MMRFLALLASALLFATPAPAQDAEHLALADRYLELSQGENLRQSMLDVITEELAKSDMPDEQRRWFTAQYTDLFVRVMGQVVRNLRDDVARLFTKDELRAAIAFMETPEGRSIMQKEVEFGFLMQQELEPLLMEGLLNLFEKYCVQFECSGQVGAVSRK